MFTWYGDSGQSVTGQNVIRAGTVTRDRAKLKVEVGFRVGAGIAEKYTIGIMVGIWS